MEKKKPHYDLDSIKATVLDVRGAPNHDHLDPLRRGARDLAARSRGRDQGMTRRQFYKSMTSLANTAVWQDVYHVPHPAAGLYVKFTTDEQGYLVISFKEK